MPALCRRTGRRRSACRRRRANRPLTNISTRFGCRNLRRALHSRQCRPSAHAALRYLVLLRRRHDATRAHVRQHRLPLFRRVAPPLARADKEYHPANSATRSPRVLNQAGAWFGVSAFPPPERGRNPCAGSSVARAPRPGGPRDGARPGHRHRVPGRGSLRNSGTRAAADRAERTSSAEVEVRGRAWRGGGRSRPAPWRPRSSASGRSSEGTW